MSGRRLYLVGVIPVNQGEGRKSISQAGKSIKVAITGVCGSGKSVLAEALRAEGYQAEAVAQEHSLVPDLFLHRDPDFVIYLEAGDDTVASRKMTGWEPSQLDQQRERLKMARDRANLRLSTDELTPAELLEKAVAALESLF